MIVSVVICTWNRARLLDLTLDNFRHLVIPEGVHWEILVVNNNCTDETDAVISRHSRSLPIRRLFEPEPGQSNARNLAISEASGELIAWTDDDVLVEEGWLASYVDAAEAWPEATYFGGPIEPQFEVPPPRWIARNLTRLSNAFAICQLGAETRPLAPGEYVLGANMATRASAFRDFDFDVEFGDRGTEKIGGDDVYLQDRLFKAARVGLWIGSARVRHLIPADRLTRSFLSHCLRGHGRAKARLEGSIACPHLLGYPRFAVRRYLSARLTMARSRPYDRRWVDAMATSAFLEGYLAEAKRVARSASPAVGPPRIPSAPLPEAGDSSRPAMTRPGTTRSN